MMKKQLGFIGGGNMANAIIGGIIESRQLIPENIYVYDCHPEKSKRLQQKYGITLNFSEQEVAKNAHILFLAVKPNVIIEVLKDNKLSLRKKDFIVISLAAGVTLDWLARLIGPGYKIIRVMSNTPALVGKAMTSVTPNALVTQQEVNEVLNIFNMIGKTEILPESLIHTVIGVSSSAPAYVYMFIEAMADAAVNAGMPRIQAYKFAAQAVKGAAQMVLQTGKHPGELKDEVCSPNGTTIEAVKLLEEKGLRAAVLAAIQSCIEKSIKIEDNILQSFSGIR